ncbi:LysE family translocator [Roseomonas sp. CCTCC AB2023176]|uniref:LysE family translocator n=1 Tax=Roseomonas sp. CCTCC AB2023176 TaxID=3342640 RepID=UPI0035D534ED
MTDLPAFIVALILAYLLPGPDMLLLLQAGSREGRRAALAMVAGLALSRASHVTLAALGLGTLLAAAPAASDGVRLAGAAYLGWLGVVLLRAPSLVPAPEPGRGAGGKDAFRRGLLTNLLNPKPLLFCSVLLPQFVQAGRGVAEQFVLLGALLVGMGIAFDLAYALAGAAIGRWFARHAALATVQRWVFALLLIGFGLQLALAMEPF